MRRPPALNAVRLSQAADDAYVVSRCDVCAGHVGPEPDKVETPRGIPAAQAAGEHDVERPSQGARQTIVQVLADIKHDATKQREDVFDIL